MITRTPLGQRDPLFIIYTDVVDAINLLVVTADPTGLPAAFSIEHVASKLATMVFDSMEGVNPDTIPRAALHGMKSQFLGMLHQQTTFNTGYKEYERVHCNRTIPVSDFFFQMLYNGGGYCGHIIDSMNTPDIQRSMPKPTTVFQVRDENKQLIRQFEYGPTAGVIIFPSNYPSNLLGRWTERNGRVLEGGEDAYIRRVKISLPDHPGVPLLEDMVSKGRKTRLTIEPEMRPDYDLEYLETYSSLFFAWFMNNSIALEINGGDITNDQIIVEVLGLRTTPAARQWVNSKLEEYTQ